MREQADSTEQARRVKKVDLPASAEAVCLGGEHEATGEWGSPPDRRASKYSYSKSTPDVTYMQACWESVVERHDSVAYADSSPERHKDMTHGCNSSCNSSCNSRAAPLDAPPSFLDAFELLLRTKGPERVGSGVRVFHFFLSLHPIPICCVHLCTNFVYKCFYLILHIKCFMASTYKRT